MYTVNVLKGRQMSNEIGKVHANRPKIVLNASSMSFLFVTYMHFTI